MTTQKHLSLDDRMLIQVKLTEKASFHEIAQWIQKDPTTVSKEIRRNRVKRRTGAYEKPANRCVLRYQCDWSGICDDKLCHYSYC